jgi:hypothetical protein
MIRAKADQDSFRSPQQTLRVFHCARPGSNGLFQQPARAVSDQIEATLLLLG